MSAKTEKDELMSSNVTSANPNGFEVVTLLDADFDSEGNYTNGRGMFGGSLLELDVPLHIEVSLPEVKFAYLSLKSTFSSNTDIAVENSLHAVSVQVDGSVTVGRFLTVDREVSVGNTLKVGLDLTVGGQVIAGQHIFVDGRLRAYGVVSEGGDLVVEEAIESQLDIKARRDIVVYSGHILGRDILAGNVIRVNGYIRAGGVLRADTKIDVGGDVDAADTIMAGSDVSAGGSISTGGTLAVDGSVRATGHVKVKREARVVGDIIVGLFLDVGAQIKVGGAIVVSGEIKARLSVEAGENIITSSGIIAGRYVQAKIISVGTLVFAGVATTPELNVKDREVRCEQLLEGKVGCGVLVLPMDLIYTPTRMLVCTADY